MQIIFNTWQRNHRLKSGGDGRSLSTAADDLGTGFADRFA